MTTDPKSKPSNNDPAEQAVQESPKSNPIIPVSPRQIQNVLGFIDATMDESVKKEVFEKLGAEHTTSPSYTNWIKGFRNFQSFLDMVNSGQDTYWEKIEYDPKAQTIRVIGRVVDRCACPYAQLENPPLSLCHYCCKSYQQHMFEMLLHKPVTVQIDDAFLLGGKRCSTTIFIG